MLQLYTQGKKSELRVSVIHQVWPRLSWLMNHGAVETKAAGKTRSISTLRLHQPQHHSLFVSNCSAAAEEVVNLRDLWAPEKKCPDEVKERKIIAGNMGLSSIICVLSCASIVNSVANNKH